MHVTSTAYTEPEHQNHLRYCPILKNIFIFFSSSSLSTPFIRYSFRHIHWHAKWYETVLLLQCNNLNAIYNSDFLSIHPSHIQTYTLAANRATTMVEVCLFSLYFFFFCSFSLLTLTLVVGFIATTEKPITTRAYACVEYAFFSSFSA